MGMTLQEKQSKKLDESLERLNWFKKEMDEYIKNGDLTQEQANILIEDMIEQLDL